MTEPGNGALFDKYATGYDQALQKALSTSGENRDFFAAGRVKWLGRCLAEIGFHPRSILDFGCGDGATCPMLLNKLDAGSVVGVDVSQESINVASTKNPGSCFEFQTIDLYSPSGELDLAYCNGVFHHILPQDRPRALKFVNNSLRLEGIFALWENNPWSLATRYVMSRCEFDRDAQMLAPRLTKTLLRQSGFEILRVDFRFIFPRSLSAFRPLEDALYSLPLGTQYQVLARKVSGV